MPSQISLRTSPLTPVLPNSGARVGHKAVTSKNTAGENGMNAATRTVGSLLFTRSSIVKPHSMVSINLNGSCGKTDNLDCTSKGSKAAFKSNGTTYPFAVNNNLGANHYAKDVVEDTMEHTIVQEDPVPVVLCNSASPKTEGEHSNEESSLTSESNRGRLMCPELAISYTGTLVEKRSKSLANKQTLLEKRLASLGRKVRLRQLHAIHSHASRQLHFEDSIKQEQESISIEDGSASSFTTDCSMEVSPLQHRKKVLPLPIQVDGASDDPFLPYQHGVMKLEGEGKPEVEPESNEGVRRRNEESFSSVESCASEPEEGRVQALVTQMTSLQDLLDGDWTESSSDEEEGEQSADPQFRLVF